MIWRALGGNAEAVRLIAIEPALTILACCLVATLAPGAVNRAYDMASGLLSRIATPRFGWIAAAVMLVASSALAWYCFGAQPSVGDEFAQRMQARIFLSGRLSAVAEPLDAFFNTVQTGHIDGRWFTVFPLGGPALHAFGEAIGMGWLVNPLLAAVTVLLLYRFVSATHGPRTAAVTAMLFIVSPFVLVMSASQINHPKALAAEAVALAALASWASATDRNAQWKAGAVIGVSIGLLAAIRPFDAVLVAIPIGFFQLHAAVQSPRRWGSVGVQVAAALALVGIVLWANARTTGDPMLFAYDFINGPAHRPGFHIDPLGNPFTPIRGFAWISQYLMRLNTALFETPVPATLFVVLTLVLLRRPTAWDYLLMGLIASTLAGYWMYWFSGDYFGPRFLYPALPAILVFCARLPAVAGRFEARQAVRGALRLVLPVALAVAWLPLAITGRLRGAPSRIGIVSASPGTNQVDAEKLARDAGLSNALVFVREPLHSTLSSQLRALGALPYTAERIVGDLDMCAIREALGHVDPAAGLGYQGVVEAGRRAGPAVPVPGLIGARSLSLAGGKPSSEECAEALEGDRTGTAAYGAFAAQNQFDGEGRLSGEVIYVRDLGGKNERLRERFPGRIWYRFVPDGDYPGASGHFEALGGPGD